MQKAKKIDTNSDTNSKKKTGMGDKKGKQNKKGKRFFFSLIKEFIEIDDKSYGSFTIAQMPECVKGERCFPVK